MTKKYLRSFTSKSCDTGLRHLRRRFERAAWRRRGLPAGTFDLPGNDLSGAPVSMAVGDPLGQKVVHFSEKWGGGSAG